MRKGSRALNLILVLAAAGLVLATIAALSARLWWAFDLFSHFRLQYVAAAGTLCVVAIAMRAYPIAAVLAVVALAHGWAIRDLWLGGSANAAPGGAPLRIVDANVLAVNPSPAAVPAFVRASDADLVVLVEANRRRWGQGAVRAGCPVSVSGAAGRCRSALRSSCSAGLPIVREEVVRAPAGAAPLSAGGADGRRAGRSSWRASIPRRPRGPEQAASQPPAQPRARPHRGRSSGTPIDQLIVAGDFNTTPWSPHFRDLIAAGGLRNAAGGPGLHPDLAYAGSGRR